MVGDLILKLFDNKSLTVGTAVSDNVLDFGTGKDEWFNEKKPNIGNSMPVLKVFITQADATNLATFVTKVEYSNDSTTWKTLQTFEWDTTDGIKTGTMLAIGVIAPRKYRYMRLSCTATGASIGAGSCFTAGLYATL